MCHVDKCSTVAGNVSKDKLYVLLVAYKRETDKICDLSSWKILQLLYSR